MTKRWLTFCIIGCLSVWCFSGCGKIGPPGGVIATEANLHGGHSGGRVLSVSMANIVGRLKRPPVTFDHDRHTEALESEPETCRLCHELDDSQNLQFAFLKDWDETRPRRLMDSLHEKCVGCHTERTKQAKESGPVTCGECHVIRREHHAKAYEPVLPEYYEALRDTYHNDCTACHHKPAKTAGHAGALDWQKFYVNLKQEAEADWPEVVFDYGLHYKHSARRDDDGNITMRPCFGCHALSPEGMQKMMGGLVPSTLDLGMNNAEPDGQSHRETSHARCINCHLAEKADRHHAGPVTCSGCHGRVEPTVAELAEVPRPVCEREARILIQLEEGANLKAVAFNHESHVANSRACNDCHHKTFQPCQECHTVEGSEKGGGVTLAEAHHDVSSTHSCVGCHEVEKSKPNCAGCHQNMQRGLVMTACTGCHNGSLEALDEVAKLAAPDELIPDDAEGEMAISVEREYGPFATVEKEYGPSDFPHQAIVERLTHISNKSTLARHFHTGQMTICSSCHHSAPLEAKADMPPCATCHTARGEPQSGVPTLLGAYHQQCLGCHQQMDPGGGELPQDCTGCHEEKSPGGKTLAAHTQD